MGRRSHPGERSRALHAPERVQRRRGELHYRLCSDGERRAWVELDGVLNVPNCTLTRANFYLEGPDAGIDLYLDDVSLREQL